MQAYIIMLSKLHHFDKELVSIRFININNCIFSLFCDCGPLFSPRLGEKRAVASSFAHSHNRSSPQIGTIWNKVLMRMLRYKFGT